MKKEKRVTLRLTEDEFVGLKIELAKKGVSFQKYIYDLIAKDMNGVIGSNK